MKKKKLLSLALAVTMLFGSAAALPEGAFDEFASVSASAEVEGDYEYRMLDDGTVEITKYNGVGGEVTIPSTLGGKNVTKIGSWAFYKAYDIESIVLPDGLLYIDSYAFGQCEDLVTISIPNSVISIGDWAFCLCTNLVSVTLPNKISTINNNTFSSCIKLNSISLPSNLKTIGDNAFNNCNSLNAISIPKGVTYIGNSAFEQCFVLSNIKIPISVAEIGRKAFYYCPQLHNIKIPASVTTIRKEAFGYGWYGGVSLQIECYKGTAAEEYAIKNGIGYNILECEHKYNDWNVVKASTCTEKGEKTRTCSICGATEIREVNALGHDYVETVVAPTCTAKGYTNHKCSRCGDEYKDTETDMIAHNFGEWTVTTKPTCTAKGVETRKCENCDKTETRDVDALGHDYVETVVAPTCTVKGYTLHKCSRCGDEYKDNETEMSEHTFGDWKTVSFDVDKGTAQQERTCTVCGKTETQTVENAIERLAGTNRFSTAAAISKASYPDGADTVILAFGLNYADALVGVPLAEKLNAPILLTHTKTLPDETLAEIKRLGAKEVIILGGEGAINKDVEKTLKKNGLKTKRIAGQSRFGTATAIANELNDDPEELFFVYGLNSADALSVGGVAAAKGAPIIYLTTDGKLNADTEAYLKTVKGKVKNAYVIGGDGVISNAMMKNVASALGLTVNKTVVRVAGANRYETCVEVNNTFKDVLTGTGICVAKGLDFPDALAGGVYAAKTRQALFLADGKKLQDVQSSYLKGKNAAKITAFGGTGAVSDELVKVIAKASV